MNVELRELRCLVAIVDAGTFTDAGIDLGMSQAAVSRNLAALEGKLGVVLLRRTTRQLQVTDAGQRALATARRVLLAVDGLAVEAAGEHSRIRLGYAWSAVGAHTLELQRRWAAAFPHIDLELVRTHSASAGLREGQVDVAILRRSPQAGPDAGRLGWAKVGTERRFWAIGTTDPWAKRRSIALSEIGARTLAVDGRTGSTTLSLWPDTARPASTLEISDIDDWLIAVASGRAVGMTSEATVHQYRRPGVLYRPVRDAPAIDVYLAWLTEDAAGSRFALRDLLTELYAAPPT